MNADSPPPTVNIFCGSGVAGARPPVRVTGRVRAGDLPVFGDDRGLTLHAVTPEDGINAVDATARADAAHAARDAASAMRGIREEMTRARAAEGELRGALEGKLTKPFDVNNGCIPVWTADGQIRDSGKAPTDFATSAQGAKADTALSRAEAEAGFTEWEVFGLAEGEYVTRAPFFELPSDWFMMTNIAIYGATGAADATSLSFYGTAITATRTRLPTMADIPTIVSPSTAPSAQGKAADAKATGDALAGKMAASATGRDIRLGNPGGAPEGSITYWLLQTDNAIERKQDAISDLDAIRSGAAAGATAVQHSALPASETWTFTVDDGQGGTTTVTKQVAFYAAQTQGAGS